MAALRPDRTAPHGANRAAVLSVLVLSATATTLAVAWPRVAPEVERALNDVAHAHEWWLLGAAASFAGVPLLSGVLWREALRRHAGELGVADACARYGIGTLLNSLAPARAGSVVRIAAFTHTLPQGSRCEIAPALVRVQTVRGLAAGATLAVAVTGVPLLAVAPLLALLRRRRLLAVAVGVQAAKVAGVACAACALGIEHPLTTALLVTAALDLAALVSVTPAGAGIATAAAAAALAARGADSAVTAAIVVHGVETAAALVVGIASAVWLGARYALGRAA